MVDTLTKCVVCRALLYEEDLFCANCGAEAPDHEVVNDAEAHEAEDKARREAIEARNKLDSLLYNTKKLVEDNTDKLPEAERLDFYNWLQQQCGEYACWM